MKRWRIAALGGLIACAAAATFACITGSGPAANLSCTQSDPQSCACNADEKGGGDAACPGASAASDTLCCAEELYPSIGSCSCQRTPIGCAFDTFGCSCGLVALDAATVPSCSAATQWASCCKSSWGCTCTLDPNAACNGTVVSSCSSSDADGGKCSLGTEDCTCSSGSQFGTATRASPQVTCCMKPATYHPGFASCACVLGGQGCGGGDQQVPSCSAAMVADAALQDFCSISQLAGGIVRSCNPPDGG